jgi:putative ABC transport system permease protein
MLRNYFNIALRTIIKNPLFSFVKISGLTVGVCGCLVIFLVARFELSFDKFQPDGDRIYRIYTEFSGVFKGFNKGVPDALPFAVQHDFTGIEAVNAFHTYSTNVEVRSSGGDVKKFDEQSDLVMANPDFFQFFNYYQWVAGNAQNLNAPLKVVLTESKAKKYFGVDDAANAMGRQIIYNDSIELTVVGIVKDISQNTDIDFQDFISFSTIEKSWLKRDYAPDDWGSTNSSSQCFIKLSEGTELAKVENQLPILVEKYKTSQKNSVWTVAFKLQPLADLHYNSEIGIFDNGRNAANLSIIRTLILAALLLLIIAAINFINLETAQAVKRSKEVGLRKTMGGTKSDLVKHFLLESTILSTIAMVMALPLTEFALQFFSEYLPQGVALNLTDPFTVLFLLITIINVSLLSGLYPAFVLSSYQPTEALKNQLAIGKTSGSAWIRKVLTIFQFSFSQTLIVGALIVSWQIKFMMDKDLGFDKDAIITFSSPWWADDNRPEVLENELARLPEIVALSRSNATPAINGTTSTTLTLLDDSVERPSNVNYRGGDTSYLSLYKIPIVAGRMVQPSDSAREFVVNEAYCREMGYHPIDMVGKIIKGEGNKHTTIVGVMRDFHLRSLHHKVEPLFFSFDKNPRRFSLKLKTADQDLTKSIEKIKTTWGQIYPDAAFSYSFVDDVVKQFYEQEKRTVKLTNTVTILTIFISCIGLFGLATFTAVQRTKEIGIRKVLGASVAGIVSLLSKEFLFLVVIAFAVACPIAWYGGSQWLTTFAYRIDLGWEIFAISIFFSVLIAFFTVGFQAMRAAMANPVESLRSE